MVISVKRTSSLEKSGVGVTYSGVILMGRIIEKNVAMERSPGTGFGSENTSDRKGIREMIIETRIFSDYI